MVFLSAIGCTFNKSKGFTPELLIQISGLTIVLLILAIIGSILARKRRAEDRSVPAVTVLFTAMTLLVLFVAFAPTRFKAEFFPATDDRQYTITIEQSVGTPLAVTNQTTREIENALRDKKRFPETKTISTVVGGTSGGGLSAGSSGADISEISVELFNRTGKMRRTDQIVKEVNDRYSNLPGVKVNAKLPESGPGGAAVSIEVKGENTLRTQEVAQQIAEAVKKTEGTFATELSWRAGRPEVQARIDRDRAAQYGLSVLQIASTLRTSMEGNTSAKYRENGKEYDIRVILPEGQRDKVTQMSTMVVGKTADGQPVYLYDVVHMENADGPNKNRPHRPPTIGYSNCAINAKC